jgi:uncharacterized repeat protein (TIGR02543 family)
MKRLTIFVLIASLFLALSGCRDRKTHDTSVTVMFYTFANDNQVDSMFHVEPNSKIQEPDVIPLRPGYEFDGWYKDIQSTNPWNFETDTVGETSVVLYAKWIVGYYRVYYDTNGGTYPTDFKLLEEYPADQQDPATNPELMKYLFFRVGENKVIFRPTRTGYTFKAWYLYDEYMWPGAPEGTKESYKPGDRGHTTYPTSTPGDITLYAHWDAVKISISFRANYPTSGVLSNPSARTRTYGLPIIYDTNYDGVSEGFNTFPDFLNRPDLEYEFVGWNTRADGNGTWYREGDILERTAALTLFAQWVLKP